MKPRVTDIVRSLVRENRYKSALRYAKGFRLGVTEEEREQMTRAYECMVHPTFYESIDMDIEDEIQKGIDVIIRLYGDKEEYDDDFQEILDAIDVVCGNCPDGQEKLGLCDGCSVTKLSDSIPRKLKKGE